MVKSANRWRVSIRACAGASFFLACVLALSPRQASAAECKVLSDAVPDVTRLQEEAVKRAKWRPLFRDRELVVGEAIPATVPTPKTPQLTPAQRRAREQRFDCMAGSSQTFGIAGAAPAASLCKEVTYTEGGKVYTGKVPASTPDRVAIESLKTARAWEARFGPEKNPLILAVDKGDVRAVKKAIAEGVDVRTVVDRYGEPTGLVARAMSRWYGQVFDEKDFLRQEKAAATFIDIIKMLVEAGADVSAPSAGITAVAIIAMGNTSDPEHPDPSAAPELAAYLLQRGATATIPRYNGKYFVLSEVATRGNERLFDVMLGHGKWTQEEKNFALLSAASYYQRIGRTGMAQRAIEAGADPNVLWGMMSFGRAPPRALLKLMVSRKVNPNLVLEDGNTPLMSVVHDHELMKDFLELGADANVSRASDGNTALHLATAFEPNRPPGYPIELYSPRIRARSVELLLRHGAKTDISNKNAITPLMQTTADDAPAIALLLDAGATVSSPDSGPVSWALMARNETLATGLARRNSPPGGSDCGAIYYAARGGAVSTLNALLDKQARKVEVSEASGETPLIGAAAAGHASTVQVLLQRKAANVNESSRVPMSANVWERQVGGMTALMAAAKWQRTDVIEVLLKNGASIEQRDKLGRTALDYASERRSEPDKEIARLLARREGVSRDPPQDREFVTQVVAAARRILLSQSDQLTLSPEPRAYPLLPGDDSGYERLECEKFAAFVLTGSANQQGGLSVSRCERNANRADQLAANAAQGLLALQKGLGENWNEAEARKAGIYSAHRTLDDGSSFHFFPVIFVGHGMLAMPTAVLYRRRPEQAVIVQVVIDPLCGREDYKDLPLCRNLEQTLQRLAVEVLRAE
jgi:ankyrin repeat protein